MATDLVVHESVTREDLLARILLLEAGQVEVAKAVEVNTVATKETKENTRELIVTLDTIKKSMHIFIFLSKVIIYVAKVGLAIVALLAVWSAIKTGKLPNFSLD